MTIAGERLELSRLAGAGLVALAAGLVRYDVARRTVRTRGPTRYMAAAPLAGYGRLAVAGALWAAVAVLRARAAVTPRGRTAARPPSTR